MLESKVVRVIVIFVIEFIILSETLQLHKKGVCVENKTKPFFISIYNMPNNTVTQNIPTKDSKRTKVETTHLKCCTGYGFDFDLDECVPLCQSGCFNGTCVDVGRCHCTPPLILVRNTCLPPTCDNCDNGDCVGMNDCKCHENYHKINNTCAPHCESTCVHGKCAAPNTCKCNPGYESDPKNKYICNPICEPKCVNGYCGSPHTCICNSDYEPAGNSSVCKPKCADCEHGRCEEPNKCICNDGYDRVNDVCKPKCSTCVHGDCVAPDKCECHDGYNPTTEGCKPICVSCTNGYCSQPNHCTCDEGYQKKDTDHSVCFKPCVPECTNGTCDLHGVCKCSRDFEFDVELKTCTPIKPIQCSECQSNCTVDSKECRCDNGVLCFIEPPEIPPENAPSTKMAGLDLTLVSIGGGCLLLLITVFVVMQRLWHRRNDVNKPTNEAKANDSVMYTVPHTLIHYKPKEFDDHDSLGEEEPSTETLLRREAQIP